MNRPHPFLPALFLSLPASSNSKLATLSVRGFPFTFASTSLLRLYGAIFFMLRFGFISTSLLPQTDSFNVIR